MKTQLKALTETLSDQAHKTVTHSPRVRIVGSLIIVASAILLFLDKIVLSLGIESSYTFGFSNFSNFLWVFCQSVAPVIMILGYLLKPYYTSFLVPVYCYTIQIIWVFRTDLYLDSPLLHTYAIGSCLLSILLFILIKKLLIINHQKAIDDKKFIEEVKASLLMLEHS